MCLHCLQFIMSKSCKIVHVKRNNHNNKDEKLESVGMNYTEKPVSCTRLLIQTAMTLSMSMLEN